MHGFPTIRVPGIRGHHTLTRFTLGARAGFLFQSRAVGKSRTPLRGHYLDTEGSERENQDSASSAVLVRVVGASPSFVQEVLSMSTSWSPLIPPSLNREPLPKDLGEYGRGITLTGLTRGKGSRADPDGDPSGREKALYRLGRVLTAAYFSASGLKEGGGDMSASIKT